MAKPYSHNNKINVMQCMEYQNNNILILITMNLLVNKSYLIIIFKLEVVDQTMYPLVGPKFSLKLHVIDVNLENCQKNGKGSR